MARQQQQRSQERGKLLLVPELYRAEVVIPSSRLRVPPSILYLLDKFIVFLLEKVNPNGNHRIDYLALVVDALKIFRGRGEKTSEDRHTKEEEEYSRPESARVIKTKQNKTKENAYGLWELVLVQHSLGAALRGYP